MGQLTGIILDHALDAPLYRQIFDQVVLRIRTGAYPVGYRLPPTRSLARELSTNRNTVVRVYEDLESAGFVSSRVGRGTFVSEPPRSVPLPTLTERPPLPWAQLASRAVEAEPHGRFDRLSRATAVPAGDVINLTRMQPPPDMIPHELLRRCLDHVMKTQGSKTLGYAPREGVPRLRAQIVADLARQGVPASAEDIVVTTGSQQALDLVARSLINPGDPFLVDQATYVGALNILSSAGARLVGVPSDAEGPDPAALERLERSGAKGFYLMPNHNNPTGLRISAARRELLVTWSHRAGVPLIEDDYAADLNLDGHPLPPALRSLDGDVIYMSTFSKRLIPALRIGFLLCPAAFRGRVGALKQTTDLCTSPLLQEALAEFLDRGYLRAHLCRILPEYRQRRDALEKGLSTHLPASLRWQRPEVGVTLWLPLPAIYPPEAVFEEAQKNGVLVSPSTLNEVVPHQHNGLRLAFAAESTLRLAEGARRLGRALTAVRERQTREPTSARQTIGVV